MMMMKNLLQPLLLWIAVCCLCSASVLAAGEDGGAVSNDEYANTTPQLKAMISARSLTRLVTHFAADSRAICEIIQSLAFKDMSTVYRFWPIDLKIDLSSLRFSECGAVFSADPLPSLARNTVRIRMKPGYIKFSGYMHIVDRGITPYDEQGNFWVSLLYPQFDLVVGVSAVGDRPFPIVSIDRFDGGTIRADFSQFKLGGLIEGLVRKYLSGAVEGILPGVTGILFDTLWANWEKMGLAKIFPNMHSSCDLITAAVNGKSVRAESVLCDSTLFSLGEFRNMHLSSCGALSPMRVSSDDGGMWVTFKMANGASIWGDAQYCYIRGSFHKCTDWTSMEVACDAGITFEQRLNYAGSGLEVDTGIRNVKCNGMRWVRGKTPWCDEDKKDKVVANLFSALAGAVSQSRPFRDVKNVWKRDMVVRLTDRIGLDLGWPANVLNVDSMSGLNLNMEWLELPSMRPFRRCVGRERQLMPFSIINTVSVSIGECLLNSAVDLLPELLGFKLPFFVDEASWPRWIPMRLNSAYWRFLFPGLYEKYPNKPMALYITLGQLQDEILRFAGERMDGWTGATLRVPIEVELKVEGHSAAKIRITPTFALTASLVERKGGIMALLGGVRTMKMTTDVISSDFPLDFAAWNEKSKWLFESFLSPLLSGMMFDGMPIPQIAPIEILPGLLAKITPAELGIDHLNGNPELSGMWLAVEVTSQRKNAENSQN